MNKILMSLITPPIAVCKFSCVDCYAAPVGVLWLAGLTALIYGSVGGPLGLDQVSWNTVGIGLLLWGLAAIWAVLATHSAKAGTCDTK